MREKILIVDDEQNIVMVMQGMLNAEGFDTAAAYGGKEALEKVKEYEPDLILLDIRMPRLDGFEVCRILKESKDTQDISIIITTALSSQDDIVKGIEAGADEFLSKPINRRELLVRIKSLLRIKSLHDEIKQKNMLLHKILDRYVAEEVFTQIMKNPDKHLRLGGEQRNMIILFADIRRFSVFSEQHSPEKVVEFLNITFSELIKVIYKYKGTFTKYLGDGIMAFYDISSEGSNTVMRVLNTAIEMKKVFGDLLREWPDADSGSLGIGIGIDTGNVVVGNIGSEKMMEYTVIGNTVNIAQRLQMHAYSDQVLISERTYQLVREQVQVGNIPPVKMKGTGTEIVVYELLHIK